MLRKIRITLAALMMIGITWLFVDFTGTAYHLVGSLAKVQLLEAVLALNFIVIAFLLVLTLLLGRIYCSIICPLGIMQDIFGWLGKQVKKNRYTYSKALTALRIAALVLFVACICLGVGSLVQILAPYSTFGLIATNLLQPVYQAGNNLLATIAEHYNSYAFYQSEIWLRSAVSLGIAVALLVLLAILAWRNGRTYCNTICPVGTILGLLARCSFLKVRFDTEKCKNCSLCTKNCKAACIDYKTHTVDASRCVVCGDCISSCKHGALSFAPSTPKKGPNNSPNNTPKKEQQSATHTTPVSEQPQDASRRSFLLSSALLATVALAQEKKKVDGGLAQIEDKVAPKRLTPLTPPGALSAQHMALRCTGCQLCISECPNQVLRPSDQLMHLMQPVMSYERGYCRPECNRCAEVCPAGAITPISHEVKVSTQIGHAVWIKKNCLPLTDGVQCGNCARHCPSEAIEMVPSDPDDEESPYIPAVNETRCIGCGACEYLCPARPFSAIYVEGHEVHKEI
jgi:polyferredoxin